MSAAANSNKKFFIHVLFLLMIFLLAVPGSLSAQGPGLEMEEAPNLSLEIIIMLIIVFALLILFILEPIRIDLIAISIPVILVVLGRWTQVDAETAISGFANNATITILAMFILSEGIQNSGLVQLLKDELIKVTGDNETKQIGMISALSGTTAGILNNTPVVAVFIPMVTGLARSTNNSPSKLLIPLSYASTMGGLLTLLGTSVNLMASDISARLLDRPFRIFEFTHLGIIVLITGVIYFITIGRKLLPDHVQPEEGLVEEYEMGLFIAEVEVEENSPLVGESVGDTLSKSELDLDLVMITRDGEEFMEPLEAKVFQAGDKLVIRSDRKALQELMSREGLKVIPGEMQVSEEQLQEPGGGRKLVETVITNGSQFAGRTLEEINFIDRYSCSILAIRRGSDLSHYLLREIVLKPGDVLLMLVNDDSLERLRKRRDIIVAREMEKQDYNQEKIPLTVGIMLVVILLAVLEVLPIAISALAGVVAMVLSGCVSPTRMYEAINWEIIILIAGLIPLGTAMEATGTAGYLAAQILELTGDLPPVLILGIFYLFTALITNLVSNRASIVMMAPVAVDAAMRLGVEPFSFILAVTFAASTAYLSPIGNQVHLMVYGPGQYEFSDYFKVGLPLQLILTVVITAGIYIFWGL
ncbi:MAG: SLC13 family permease [Bacillota bacterium]